MAGRPDDPAIGRDRLFSDRYQTHFERWVHSRIPAWARPVLDPRVVVQQTLDELARDSDWAQPCDGPMLDRFRHALYKKVLERVHQVAVDIASDDATLGSVLPLRDQTIERDLLRKYEAALRSLPPAQRNAIVARTELALPWSGVSLLLNAPHVAAARATVSRALIQVAREMSHD